MANDPIKELPNGKFRFRLDVGTKPNGKRDQRCRTFDSYAEADTALKVLLAELATGEHVKSDKALTVRSFLTEWQAMQAADLRDNSQRAYADALDQVIRLHGGKPLYDLDVPDVIAVRDGMRSGKLRRRGTPGTPLSAAAVNLMLVALSAALKTAVTRKLIRFNPASSDLVKRVTDKGKDRRVRAARGSWTTAHGTRMATATEGHRLAPALLLSLLGLRRGEVLGLNWDRDIDLDGEHVQDWAQEWGLGWSYEPGTPCLRVSESRIMTRQGVANLDPKTESSARILPLPSVAVAALRTWKTQQARERLAAGSAWTSTGLVFTDPGGNGLRPEWYSDEWLRVGKAAGLPRITLHGARHWTASRLGESVPYGVAQAWLGHAKSGVTMGYTHVSPDAMVSAARTLGTLLTIVKGSTYRERAV